MDHIDEAKKGSKMDAGTSPAQAPRKSGPFKAKKVGAAGGAAKNAPPDGGKTVTPNKGTARGKANIGGGNKTGTKLQGPTTSANKTGTVSRKKK